LRIIDVLTSPWAIEYNRETGRSDKLAEIQAIYSAHLRGESIDISAVEEKVGHALDNEQKPYQVVNGIALIELSGIVTKRMNLFSKVSGGISTEIALRDFRQAMADNAVTGIILIVDSPGGTVDGTAELASAINEASNLGSKPILTYTDGTMASAAYWIGAAADRVYINNDTARVGSIGVVATHVDYSQYEAKLGIKTTEVYAGKYKRIASEYAPLSKEGRRYMQDEVNYYYTVFADAVAGFRPGLQIPQDGDIPWADGRIFIGRQSIEAGLVDGIATLDQLVSRLSNAGGNMIIKERMKDSLTKKLAEQERGNAAP